MSIAKTDAASPLLEGQALRNIMQPVLPQFVSFLRWHLLFHMAAWALIGIELLALFLFFTFLAQSMLMALALSTVFLTLFSYLMLRLYFQTIKPEQLQVLKKQFVDTYKTLTHYREGVAEHYLGLSHACCKLADEISGSEYRSIKLPKLMLHWFNELTIGIEKWCSWWQWQDVHQMRELLLLEAAEEQIKLVRSEPTNPEAHVALANVYVLLSMLYAAPLKGASAPGRERWLHDSSIKKLQCKFRETANKAIEEFHILCDYAPNDPWVHLQLAYSYHDLEMPLEEIGEYETILHLQPDDQDTRFKLGSLYFKQGMNAKGLRIYEELRRSDPKRAEALIRLYSA